jgi:hypothetical protein
MALAATVSLVVAIAVAVVAALGFFIDRNAAH